MSECTCKNDMVSMMCPVHGEELARGEVEHDELVEIKTVLQWASENVVTAWGSYTDSRKWSVFIVGATEPMEGFTGPTLYQALHSAWEARDK